MTSLTNDTHVCPLNDGLREDSFSLFIFLCWNLITSQYCSGLCHILTWISHGFTCVPHPDAPSCLPLHPIPLDHPSAPALSTCLMHPTWAGDLFHCWYYTCFNAILSEYPTLAFSHTVQKFVLYICDSFSPLHLGLSLTSFSFFFSFFVSSFIFISLRLYTSQCCSGFCHTLTCISHGFTCIPHPNPPSHLPLYPIPLGLPSAPGPSTCLMHPTWAGDLFHYR